MYINAGHADRAARRARRPRSGRGGGARRSRATCSSRATGTATYYVAPRFMGFFVLDPDTGAVVSQFPHAVPGVDRDRLRPRRPDRRAAGRAASGACSACSRCISPARGCSAARPAAAAAALLALQRRPGLVRALPERRIVMQALLFAALLANARAHVDDDRFFAPVAGLLLGLLLFLRFDAVVAIGGGGRRRWRCGSSTGQRAALDVLGAARRRLRAGRAGTCSGRCAQYVELPLVFSPTCRGGSTRRSPSARRALLAVLIVGTAVAAAVARGSSTLVPVVAGGRSCCAGDLRARFLRSPAAS